jgi:hypothetical protein
MSVVSKAPGPWWLGWFEETFNGMDQHQSQQHTTLQSHHKYTQVHCALHERAFDALLILISLLFHALHRSSSLFHALHCSSTLFIALHRSSTLFHQ